MEVHTHQQGAVLTIRQQGALLVRLTEHVIDSTSTEVTQSIYTQFEVLDDVITLAENELVLALSTPEKVITCSTEDLVVT